jgi:hypothetical protein
MERIPRIRADGVGRLQVEIRFDVLWHVDLESERLWALAASKGMISGVELAMWFAGMLRGIISLGSVGSVFTPGYGSHFGGLGVLGILTGVIATALLAVGLTLTRGRRWRERASPKT